ncbi:MAG: hypothetical protein QOF71_637 [Candidatus Eremiobacteraeota bacterium]|jgi:hypothetical protein|nr:hypothetical protein [Candidatus Eremiobacteraeota bacterium]
MRPFVAVLCAVLLMGLTAQSPAPSGSPQPAPSPTVSPTISVAPGTKLVVTTACGPVAALRSAPIADVQNVVRDSAGNRVLLPAGSEAEAKAGGENATSYLYVEAPTRDGPRNGYVGRPCLKARG